MHLCLPYCTFSITRIELAVDWIGIVGVGFSEPPSGKSKSESSKTPFMYKSISLSVTSHKLANTNWLKEIELYEQI